MRPISLKLHQLWGIARSSVEPKLSKVVHQVAQFTTAVPRSSAPAWSLDQVFGGILKGSNPNARYASTLKGKFNGPAFNHTRSITSRSRPSVSFRSSTRPTFNGGRNTSNVGLAPARQFSSTRPVFENIINNTPFYIRALIEIDGIDAREWKGSPRRGRVDRMVRMDHELAQRFGRNQSKGSRSVHEVEFAKYWSVDEDAAVVVKDSPIVTLIFSLEPVLPAALAPSSSTPHANEFDLPRLLSPLTLIAMHQIERAYTTHSHRINAVNNLLTNAGVFDNPKTSVEVRFSERGDQKQVWITFARGTTRRDVERIVGDHCRGDWCRLIESGMVEEAQNEEGSLTMSMSDHEEEMRPYESSESLYSDSEFDDDHDSIASTFIFPTINLDNSDSFSFEPDNAHLDYENGLIKFLDELDDVERERDLNIL